MMPKQTTYDVGVVLGRFQVDELHGAHLELLQYAADHHDKMIVFVGLSSLRCTRENPLDFQARQQMILEAFPKAIVSYIANQRSDVHWSRKFDQEIRKLITPNQSVVIYGGRDSFIKRYHGKLPTIELEQAQEAWLSGKELRRQIGTKSAMADPAFRRGVIWAAYGDYPRTQTMVDVAIFNEAYTKALLVRKVGETLFRFPGGHVEHRKGNLQANVRAEAQEETNVDITDPQFINSFVVDDWRYEGEADGVMTTFFGCKYLSGNPRPIDEDEISEVKWFDLDNVQVVPEHEALLKAAQAWAATQDKR